MYTQCSSCTTLFRVGARHLREAQGLVRCCLCHETFNALETLADRLPQELPSVLRPVEPSMAAAVDRVEPTPEPEVTEPVEEEPVRGDPFAELDLPVFAELDAEPELERERPRRHGWATVLWGLGSLLLLALLALQVGHYLVQRAAQVPEDRWARYVQEPSYRQWFEAVCRVTGCKPPLLRDASRVHILQRRLAAHPTKPNALLLTATLVNRADFPQRFPQLQLSLLDQNGRERAARWFEPSEYLESDELLAQGMRPGQPVALRLELVDPGRRAADGFKIDFR
jgi:predicted Zn finger-like uncharacterized protein